MTLFLVLYILFNLWEDLIMKRFIYILIVLTISVGIVAGCTSEGGESNENSSSSQTVLVTHELGETEVKQNPENVIVFDFGMLDTLDYLGIDVVGVPQQNIPDYLEQYHDDKYKNIGSLKEPDYETIANIDPDLIIISGRQADQYDELKKLGPVVHLGIDFENYYDSFQENVITIGEIFDKEEEIEEALSSIDKQINNLANQAEEFDKEALIILANDDKISAYGPNSRFGIIHDLFGIPAIDENIEASTHGMNVSFEYVTEMDPDLLYVIDRSAAIGEESAAKNIVENPLMNSTKALQNEDIYYLNPDVWYLSGGGILSVQEMVKEIKASLQ